MIERRERRLAERLLDDESLRGDLDDTTWQPLQDWLLAVAARLAAATVDLDEEAARAYLDRGRRVLVGVARAAAEVLDAGASAADVARGVEPLVAAVGPPVFSAAHADEARAALRQAARQVSAERPSPAYAARQLAAILDDWSGESAPARGGCGL